jgi:hypothetical protein
MHMPNETISNSDVKTAEPVSAPLVIPAKESGSLSISHLISFCAIGLGICFFLPWFSFLFVKPSGFDFAKDGGVYLLLWILPFFCVLTFFAGVTKTSQRNAAIFTGILPFVILGIGCTNLGADLLKALEIGGYGGLGFGLALIVLPCLEP